MSDEMKEALAQYIWNKGYIIGGFGDALHIYKIVGHRVIGELWFFSAEELTQAQEALFQTADKYMRTIETRIAEVQNGSS
jgi:hypothetical protein